MENCIMASYTVLVDLSPIKDKTTNVEAKKAIKELCEGYDNMDFSWNHNMLRVCFDTRKEAQDCLIRVNSYILGLTS